MKSETSFTIRSTTPYSVVHIQKLWWILPQNMHFHRFHRTQPLKAHNGRVIVKNMSSSSSSYLRIEFIPFLFFKHKIRIFPWPDSLNLNLSQFLFLSSSVSVDIVVHLFSRRVHTSNARRIHGESQSLIEIHANEKCFQMKTYSTCGWRIWTGVCFILLLFFSCCPELVVVLLRWHRT